jgi:hypothetical protein
VSGKYLFGILGANARIILKWILQEKDMGLATG